MTDKINSLGYHALINVRNSLDENNAIIVGRMKQIFEYFSRGISLRKSFPKKEQFNSWTLLRHFILNVFLGCISLESWRLGCTLAQLRRSIIKSCVMTLLTRTCKHTVRQSLSAQVGTLTSVACPQELTLSVIEGCIQRIRKTNHPGKKRTPFRRMAVVPYWYRTSRNLRKVGARNMFLLPFLHLSGWCQH